MHTELLPWNVTWLGSRRVCRSMTVHAEAVLRCLELLNQRPRTLSNSNKCAAVLAPPFNSLMWTIEISSRPRAAQNANLPILPKPLKPMRIMPPLNFAEPAEPFNCGQTPASSIAANFFRSYQARVAATLHRGWRSGDIERLKSGVADKRTLQSRHG